MKTYQIWQCKIGAPYFEVAKSQDSPMREAVQTAFERVISKDGFSIDTAQNMVCFSGWNAKFSTQEIAMIQGKAIFPAEHAQFFISARDIANALMKVEKSSIFSSMNKAKEIMKAIHEN